MQKQIEIKNLIDKNLQREHTAALNNKRETANLCSSMTISSIEK